MAHIHDPDDKLVTIEGMIRCVVEGCRRQADLGSVYCFSHGETWDKLKRRIQDERDRGNE